MALEVDLEVEEFSADEYHSHIDIFQVPNVMGVPWAKRQPLAHIDIPRCRLWLEYIKVPIAFPH